MRLELLGIDHYSGNLEKGRKADLVILEWDEENFRIEIKVTIAEGRMIYKQTN
ncbi:MAG: amidohydrolase family protein [Acidobacteria bacterium]|nr:amidohydrolase family protein [Acidobacteriota bacterium]